MNPSYHDIPTRVEFDFWYYDYQDDKEKCVRVEADVTEFGGVEIQSAEGLTLHPDFRVEYKHEIEQQAREQII